MRKSKMAAILLYEMYRFSYLHPQMNSVWRDMFTVYPTTKMPHLLVGLYILFSRISWIRKKK